jgi:hypothetical protein
MKIVTGDPPFGGDSLAGPFWSQIFSLLIKT